MSASTGVARRLIPSWLVNIVGPIKISVNKFGMVNTGFCGPSGYVTDIPTGGVISSVEEHIAHGCDFADIPVDNTTNVESACFIAGIVKHTLHRRDFTGFPAAETQTKSGSVISGVGEHTGHICDFVDFEIAECPNVPSSGAVAGTAKHAFHIGDQSWGLFQSNRFQ